VILFDPLLPDAASLAKGLPRHDRDAAVNDAVAWREAQLRAAGYEPAMARQGRVQGSGNERKISDAHQREPWLLPSWIMPLAAAVVDELEICNFAVSLPLFAALGMDPPMVWPRVSGTILDLRSRKLLARYGLQLNDLFDGAESVAAGLMRRLAGADVPGRLRSLQADLDRHLGDLEDPIAAADRLRGRIENARRRMRHQIGKLESRFSAARQMREAAILRQVSRLCDNLTPGGGLQEREYAGIQFVLRHSMKLPQILYESIDPWKFTHQFIPVE
jgi:uncharacterized protein YllA (UPF0747 family)